MLVDIISHFTSSILPQSNCMEFDHYQDKTEETAIYPEDEAISYLALGLNGEAGEVAEKIKKHELGDILWYLSRLADELGFDMDDVAGRNIEKLFDRKERDKLSGSGDNR